MEENKIIEAVLQNREKLKDHEKQIDFIAQKMIEHDEQFRLMREEMATKEDIRRISDTLDTLVGLAKKRDQETTMLTHTVQRHEEEIGKIKPLVGLV